MSPKKQNGGIMRIYRGFPKQGYPKSSILVGFSIVNHPAVGGTPMSGNSRLYWDISDDFTTNVIWSPNTQPVCTWPVSINMLKTQPWFSNRQGEFRNHKVVWIQQKKIAWDCLKMGSPKVSWLLTISPDTPLHGFHSPFSDTSKAWPTTQSCELVSPHSPWDSAIETRQPLTSFASWGNTLAGLPSPDFFWNDNLLFIVWSSVVHMKDEK